MNKKVTLNKSGMNLIIKSFKEKDRALKMENYKLRFTEILKIARLVNKENFSTETRKAINRLILGYDSFCGQNGIKSGFISKDANSNLEQKKLLQRKKRTETSQSKKEKIDKELKNLKNTDDHVFGATMIGEKVTEALISNNFNIDYMVNEWLPNNIYLWMTIEITYEEHLKIKKNKDSFEDKFCLKHYNKSDAKVSELIFKQVK